METPAAFGGPPYKAPRLTSSETLQDIANQLLDCAKRIANSTWMANYVSAGVPFPGEVFFYFANHEPLTISLLNAKQLK